VSALTIPVAAPPKDKRNDFVPGREFDEVRVLDETNRVIRGRIPRADPTKPQDPIVLIIDEQNRPQRFPREKVAISFSQTYLQKYLEDAKTVGDVIRDRVRFAKQVFDWGMIPEAKAEFEIVLQRKQDEWESLDKLVELYLADLEFEKAVELLDSVVRRVDGKDKQSKARFRLGGIWERLGLLDKALNEYDQAFPSVIEAGILRGRVLYKKGELKEALEALSEALRMPVPAEQMAPLGYALRGLTRLQLNASPEGLKAALADLDESLRRLATEPGALNGRGVVRSIQGDYKGGMEDFAASLKNDPYHAPAWINMAILLVARGSLDEAEACIAAGLQRCPGAHELQSLRGVIKLARGKSEEAKADFDASHLIRKDNFFAHYGHGIVHLRGGRFPEAKQSLVEAVKRDFYFSPSYYSAAVANIKAGDLETAESLLREIMRQRPGYRDAIVALTLLLLRQGRIAESQLVFQEIVDKIAGNGNLLYVNGFITYNGDDPNVERRVQQTRDHLLDAAAAGSTHAPGVVRELNEWLATYVLFNEGFSRADSPKVGAGWQEGDHEGVLPIRIVKERVRFSGRGAGGEANDIVYVPLEREVPGKDFYSVEATYYPTVVRKLDAFGLALLIPQGGSGGGARGPALRIKFDTALGRPVLAYVANVGEDALRKEQRWVTSPLPFVVNPDEIRLRIVIEREEGGSFIGVHVFDKQKNDWVNAMPRQGYQAPTASFKLSLFVRARMSAEFELELDNVRVLERRSDE